MALEAVHDTVKVDGVPLRIIEWRMVNRAGDVRVLELVVIPDERLTINGKTVEEMTRHADE